MLHFHLSTTPISSKIRFIIEGLTRISQICTDFVVASNGDSHLVSMEKLRRSRRFVRFVRSVWENSTFLTLLLWILSQTFLSSPCSRRPSGRDRRDRTCDTSLPCCQDSPLSASPGLWCSDASSAKNEADSRTGYDWHNPLRHA